MRALSSLGVRARLWGLLILFGLGIAGFGVAAFGALRSVQVGGMYYEKVMQGKDLIADVLPPPLYISESYQVMLRMAGEMDPVRLRALIDKSHALEEEFRARRAYWLSAVADSTIRRDLEESCTRPAVDFYEVVDRLYIPALLRERREAAFDLARGVLTEKYEGQRGAVLALVAKLTAQQAATEREAAEVVTRRTRLLLLYAVGILALAGGCAWLLARSIVGPLGRTAEALGLVATGDLTPSVESHSSDELGRMARALNETLFSMRTALDADRVDWADVGRQRAEVNRIRQLVENARINITCADRDLVLVYLNPAARSTFGRLAVHLPMAAGQLLGQSLLRLHPGLAAVRDRLLDPARLPLELRVEVGPDSLDLTATAIHDEQGRYVGPMVTWEVVTERLAAERTAREAQEQALRLAEEQRQAEAAEAARRQAEQQARVEGERAQAAELRARVDQILGVVSAAAEGDLTREIGVSGDDAVGRLADGLRRLLGDLRERIRGIARTATALGGASEKLSGTASGIREAVGNVSAEARVVATATAEVSDHVQTVAAGTEEMNASIRDISKSTSTAAVVAGRAVEVASRTNVTVTKLGESSAEIGKVIKVITSIAQQTNLLALNATIEAARAGEAGKGFAVVANEVKELAKETARATEEIGGKIEAIQADTGDAVTAIQEISEIIAQINDIQTSVAGAVEEQTATTNEMSRNVAEAASGSGEIVRSIAQMARTAAAAAAGANEGQEAAHELARMAAELQGLIDRFRLEAVDRPAPAPASSRQVAVPA